MAIFNQLGKISYFSLMPSDLGRTEDRGILGQLQTFIQQYSA